MFRDLRVFFYNNGKLHLRYFYLALNRIIGPNT